MRPQLGVFLILRDRLIVRAEIEVILLAHAARVKVNNLLGPSSLSSVAVSGYLLSPSPFPSTLLLSAFRRIPDLCLARYRSLASGVFSSCRHPPAGT